MDRLYIRCGKLVVVRNAALVLVIALVVPARTRVREADVTCSEQIACAIERGDAQDDCGGGAGAAMLDCLGACSTECLVPSRARVSQVARVDWDGRDGPERALTIVRADAPIRIVGAGTSPCVPTGPF